MTKLIADRNLSPRQQLSGAEAGAFRGGSNIVRLKAHGLTHRHQSQTPMTSWCGEVSLLSTSCASAKSQCEDDCTSTNSLNTYLLIQTYVRVATPSHIADLHMRQVKKQWHHPRTSAGIIGDIS
jgi:hypothetical protein